jgi:hypothetical protein
VLIIDGYNVMYSGNSNSRALPVGHCGDKFLKCIPYFLNKLVNFAALDSKVVVVFDPDEKSIFNDTSGYKQNRVHQPNVLWEIRILKKMLDFIGIPTVQLNCEADDVIYSILQDHCNDDEDHYIVSTDKDLACNVAKRGIYQTKMLAFNSVGYNYTYENFYSLLGIPFNFININKLLLGCKSDTIPPVKNGTVLWSKFVNSLRVAADELTLGATDDPNKLYMYDALELCNTYEYFKVWLQEDVPQGLYSIEELDSRMRLIFPKYVRVPLKLKWHWDKLNALTRYLLYTNANQMHKAPEAQFTDEDRSIINGFIDSTPLVKPTVFQNIESVDSVIVGLEDLSIFEED